MNGEDLEETYAFRQEGKVQTKVLEEKVITPDTEQNGFNIYSDPGIIVYEQIFVFTF